MEVKLLEQKGNKVKLLIKDTDPAFVNGLRRQIMAGTPILAIEDVFIYENSGAMPDEMLCHRLGLVPLKMDPKKYKEDDKARLVLEIEGPCMVYSRDVKSTDPQIEPVDLNIPITKLGEGQKIKIEMDAVIGKGKQHSKWQPAVVSYQELPIIVSDRGSKEKAYKADVIELLLDEKHRDLIPKEGQHIEYDSSTFVFTVESHGNIGPMELIDEAVKSLKEKTVEFRRELKNLS